MREEALFIEIMCSSLMMIPPSVGIGRLREDLEGRSDPSLSCVHSRVSGMFQCSDLLIFREASNSHNQRSESFVAHEDRYCSTVDS